MNVVLPARRLIINADDFGRSHSINQAVIRAHRDGVLTTASLMVNGEAFDEAVELARQHLNLGVGLHLTLVCGTASLPREKIPGLINEKGEFSNDPIRSGLAYFTRQGLRKELKAEMAAQFEKFCRTGLALDHVDGHLNMHLHPTVFALLMEDARTWNVTALRLTRDPFWLNVRLARGSWLYRISHAFIYSLLSRHARPALWRLGIRHTQQVFGLLQNARVNEEFFCKLISQLPRGDSELYSHPSLDEFKHEFDALISPRVRKRIEEEEIELIRYQDL